MCVTLGLTPPGPDGEGTLAVVSFKTSKNGTSPMALSNVKLVHPDGSVLTSTTVDGKLTIGGSGGLGTGARIAIGGGAAVIIIGVIAFLVLRRRRLAAPMSTDADSPGGDVTQL